MFDNLAYDDLILRFLKICNFHNMWVYFRFKTVDLNSITFHHYISSLEACNLIFPLRTMGTCISCLTSISVRRRECCGSAYQVLI